MKKEDTSFTYEYSAQMQEEVMKIRDKYLPPKEDEISLLRKLDEQAERLGVLTAVSIGVFGIMLFGLGMTCVLKWKAYFVEGVVLGIIGMIMMGMALPLNRYIIKKQREKLAPQVLELTERLLQNQSHE